MAAIRKRLGPGGRQVWQVQIIKKGHPAQYRTFDLKKGAEVWAKKVESGMDGGVFVPRTEAESTTLAAALKRYEKEVSSKSAGPLKRPPLSLFSQIFSQKCSWPAPACSSARKGFGRLSGWHARCGIESAHCKAPPLHPVPPIRHCHPGMAYWWADQPGS